MDRDDKNIGEHLSTDCSHIDRRLFLKLSALVSLAPSAIFLSGCEGDTLEIPQIELPKNIPFDIWRAIKISLSTSPDNLQQRAMRLVKDKEVAAIFEFVRDNFQTRPYLSRVYPFRQSYQVHGGWRSLLRTGVGTAREKAELLMVLCQQAGLEAEIVEGKLEKEFNILSRYQLIRQNIFRPDFAKNPVREWLDALNLNSDLKVEEHANIRNNVSSNELSKQLFQLFKKDVTDKQPNWLVNSNWVPLVKIKRNRGLESGDNEQVNFAPEEYLNPNIPEAGFGLHYCSSQPKSSQIKQPIKTKQVKVKLLAARLASPNKPFELLNAEWQIEDLVGRRLLFGFQPSEELPQRLNLRLNQLINFLPYMAVQGDKGWLQQTLPENVIGDALNIEGDQFSEKDQQIHINGQPISRSKLEIAENYQELSKLVDYIDIKARAAQYPKVNIEATIRDKQGRSVQGLPASLFSLKENGSASAVSMTKNRSAKMRVLFVSDFSSSVPVHLRGANLSSLYEKIITSVNLKNKSVKYRVAKIQDKKRKSYLNYLSEWQTDADDVVQAISKAKSGYLESSQYVGALAEAVNLPVDLVVMITDGDSQKDISPNQRARLNAGCESLLIKLTTAKTNHQHFKDLSNLTRGQVLESSETTKIAEAISSRIDQMKDASYLFSYYSSEGNGNHQTPDAIANNEENPAKEDKDEIRSFNKVELKLVDQNILAETKYDIPIELFSAARALSGLYLQISIGKQKAFRTLAGYPLKSRYLKEEPITEKEVEHTRNALFGQYQLSFEVDCPTGSATLTDEIDRNLSMETLHQAVKTKKAEEIVSALESGFSKFSKYAYPLNPAWSSTVDGKHLTFQAGFQVVLHSFQADEQARYQHQSDLLPFVRWQSVANNNRDAIKLSLQRSLDWALLETKYFASSTAKLLDKTPLSILTFKKMNLLQKKSAWKILFARQQKLNRYRIYATAKNLDQLAYWEIDPVSGTVVGILPDATGGGRSAAVGAKFDRLSDGLDKFTEVLGMLSNVSPAFEVWIELEKAKIQHLKRATMAMIEMDGSFTSGYGDLLADQITGFVEDQVTGAIEDAGTEHLPGFENLVQANELRTRSQELWSRFGRD